MPKPVGYAKSHEKPCTSRGDCVIGVGFSRIGTVITRFLVDLQYSESFHLCDYTQIARFDHNPANPKGHDIRAEGIHVDARRKHGQDETYYPAYSYIPSDLGIVIRACTEYLDEHADFFVDFYEGEHRPSTAPGWSP